MAQNNNLNKNQSNHKNNQLNYNNYSNRFADKNKLSISIHSSSSSIKNIHLHYLDYLKS